MCNVAKIKGYEKKDHEGDGVERCVVEYNLPCARTVSINKKASLFECAVNEIWAGVCEEEGDVVDVE
jgi:hypothetical protein